MFWLSTDTFLFSDKMLNDDICHIVSVSIPILIQAMYGTEHKLIVRYGAILAANSLCVKKHMIVNSLSLCGILLFIMMLVLF